MEEYEDILDIIFDKISFFLSIQQGNVMPIDHDNYYDNRLNIMLTEEEDLNKVEITGKNYDVSEDSFNTIKNYSKQVLDKLINISKNQDNQVFFGNDTNIVLKVNSIMVIICKNNLLKEDQIFIDEFINFVINNIK